MTEKNLPLSDSDIRPFLRSKLLQKHANQADTVIIDELGLCRGQVRVDVSVVNGLLHGYEIKSDRDSLRRLESQIAFYGKVLDRATLVVGSRHLSEACSIVPAWWGILHAGVSAKGIQLRTVRSSKQNPQRDPRALVELLWLDDALSLLNRRNAARGVRGKTRWVVWNRVCEVLGVDEIARAVRIQLKARVKKKRLG